MTHDLIDRLVRPANPVPDPKMLGDVDVSALHVEWKEEMQTQKVEVDRAEESREGGLLIGIAAALVVVIGGLVVFQMTDTPEVAAGATPVEIATAYVEAYGAFDVEAVEAMLAEDARVLPWESYEPRDWKADLRFLEAAGFELIIQECTELPVGTQGVRVNCQYEAHGLGSAEIGEGPFGGSTFRLVMADGLVTSSDMGFNFNEFSRAMWFPFQSWIEENHPEDFDQLYVNSTLSRQTDDAIVLWEQRVADYVEYVNNPTPTTTP
jgi:hypothetical protein